MVFSSPVFLFLFLPVTFLLYFAVPLKWRNLVLLAVSLVFYAWGEPVYVFLMIATILVDYVAGYLVGKYRESDRGRARTVVILATVLNLAALAFFKYADFFLSNINAVFGLSLPLVGLALPIGISFYTFQALSYVIDVYRLDADAQKSAVAFGAYVTLFPQLIAGPIVRYADVDRQLTDREHSVPLFASGVRTFVCGLGKKVLLANTAGSLWESLKDAPGSLGAFAALLFYAFQIYFDFSGYSDMAIGLGKMFGFRFRENFDYPYTSTSVSDFWRRWHISLGTWFREYVYIPLGGNRRGRARTYLNLLIVWLLTGFWHGASWNYILWGLYYGLLLMAEKAFLSKWLDRLPAFVSRVYTLVAVYFGWWLFVFEDLGAGVSFLGRLFGPVFTTGVITYDVVRNLPFLAVLILASLPQPKRLFHKYYEKSAAFRMLTPVLVVIVLVASVAVLVSSSYNPFLYFRF